MSGNLRLKNLALQHLDVALVYKDMLGLEEALAYLERANVPRDLAERMLMGERRDKIADDQPAAAPPLRCRRKNRVHDAIVEAALKIETKLGAEYARALLRDENVPDEVAARILAPGPRQLRARPRAP